MGQAWGGDLTGSSGHALEYMIKHWEGPPGDFRGQKEFPVQDCSECLSSPETPVNLLVHLKLPASVHVSAPLPSVFLCPAAYLHVVLRRAPNYSILNV